MFDTVGAFKAAFVPHQEGYIYYRSAKSGGRFVTQAEYEGLISHWRRISSWPHRLAMAAAVIVALFVWTAIKDSWTLPHWGDAAVIAVVVACTCGYLLWASTAAWRLTRDRAEITPPRARAVVMRNFRARFTWPLIVFILLFSGAAALGGATATERSLKDWLWMLGGGSMFAAYLWIAFQKWRDGRADHAAD